MSIMRLVLWFLVIHVVQACTPCDDSNPCTIDSCPPCVHTWKCTASPECVLHLEHNEQGQLLKPWEPCLGQTFSNCTSIQVVLSQRKYITLSKEEDITTPCNPNPCAGVCEIHGDTFKCKCSAGQYGERCFETLYTLSTHMLLAYSVGIAAVIGLCLITCLLCTNSCLPVKTVIKKVLPKSDNIMVASNKPLRF